MTYSKKQMTPLIDKYGINPETNQLFINICEMFDGQPNYQLWGVKVIFSKVTNMDTLNFIKNWSDENQTLVQKLDKKNIIPYSSKTAIAQLVKEIHNLNDLAFVKSVIDTFNTAQRKLLNEYISSQELTSLNLKTSSNFQTLLKYFKKFIILPADRKHNFINKNSATRSIDTLILHIKEAIQESYEWNREDLLAFVKNNTPDCDVVYDNGTNIVILQVKSYKSSATLCAGGRTNWCITTSDGQWKNYVTSNNNSQYFFFDFSKIEKDELAHIGFTVSSKDGIIHAHSTTDRALVGQGINYNGSQVNIQKAMKMANVSYASFMPKKTHGYKWDMEDILKVIKGKKHDFAIAYSKNNRLIINVLSNKGLRTLCEQTYIRLDNYNAEDSQNHIYVLLDLNKTQDDDNSIILINFAKDQYGTPSLKVISDMYGADMTKDGYIASLGISTDDYLNRETISPDVLLHKLIDEGDEKGALKLIQENADTIDINFQFNNRIPVYSAMQNKMFDLMSYLIKDEKFKTTSDDELTEPLLNSLLYLYSSEDLCKTSDDEKGFEMMIRAILDSPRFDFNDQDLNLDSAVNICCEKPKLAWVARILINRPETNVNIINEFECSALTNAICNSNKTALTELGKRPDLIVRDIDKEMAKEHKVDLKKYLNPQPMAGLEKIVRKEPKKAEFDFAALFERALAACR